MAERAATTNQDAVLNDPRPEANEVTIQVTELQATGPARKGQGRPEITRDIDEAAKEYIRKCDVREE